MSTQLCINPTALVHLVLLAVSLAGGSARGAFVPLFNGVDFTGWQVIGGNATFQVEDGEIVGQSAPGTPNTFLVTDQEYGDFVLELEFQIFDPSFNSGVQLRSRTLPTHNDGRLFGYQVEIDPSNRAWSGGIYFEGGSPDRPAGWLDDLSDVPAAQAAFELGEWNHFRIIAQGRRITTWINGVPAADYIDLDRAAFLPSGSIGLQVHSNSSPTPLDVRWRNLLIDELDPGPNQTIGDFDGDGVLDLGDYLILVNNLRRNIDGLSTAEAYLSGDLNGDNELNYQDFLVFRGMYPSTAKGVPTRAAPEPETASVLYGAVVSGLYSLRFRPAKACSANEWAKQADKRPTVRRRRSTAMLLCYDSDLRKTVTLP